MTNADMIRHMSNDELEDFICRITNNCQTDSHSCMSDICPIFDACGNRNDVHSWLSEGSTEIDKAQALLDFIAREEFTAVTESCSSLLSPEHVDVVRTDTLREFIEKLFPDLI